MYHLGPAGTMPGAMVASLRDSRGRIPVHPRTHGQRTLVKSPKYPLYEPLSAQDASFVFFERRAIERCGALGRRIGAVLDGRQQAQSPAPAGARQHIQREHRPDCPRALRAARGALARARRLPALNLPITRSWSAPVRCSDTAGQDLGFGFSARRARPRCSTPTAESALPNRLSSNSGR